MVPRIGSNGGKSFAGCGLYYLHDKGTTETAERVGFTHTLNVPTQDPDKALKWMAYTAIHQKDIKEAAGRSTRGPKTVNCVMTYSLSWKGEVEQPTKAEMLEAAQSSLEHMGLAEHEVLIVEHTETRQTHPHVHLIVNLIHPETGMKASVSNDQVRIQNWAEKYERSRGQNLCPARTENRQARRDKSRQKNWIKHPNSRRTSQFYAGEKERKRELEERAKAQRQQLSQAQKRERERLYQAKERRVKACQTEKKQQARPGWQALYARQKREVEALQATHDSAWGRLQQYFAVPDKWAGSQLDRRGMLSQVHTVAAGSAEQVSALNWKHADERVERANALRAEIRTALREINAGYREELGRLKTGQADERRELKARQAKPSRTVMDDFAQAAKERGAETPKRSFERSGSRTAVSSKESRRIRTRDKGPSRDIER